MKQDNKILLHLSLIPGIGPITINKIVNSCIPLEQLYQLIPKDLVQRCAVSSEQAKKIVIGLADTDLLEKELNLIDTHAINWTTFLDTTYPDQLKHINGPPAVLYWRGGPLSNDHKRIAFVGARRAKGYARRSLEHIIPELVVHGWSIVSGGAVGADTMAHQITLEAGGTTHAILGSGLLCPYPQSNKTLFETIIGTGGSVISSFPLLTEPLPGNFPARNRLISGLSLGSVVVQAAQKSGALITAYHALEQGKEVFAVPGQIDDELSTGCHQLITQGAHLVTSAQDILDVFGMSFRSCNDNLHQTRRGQPVKKKSTIVLSKEEQAIVDCCAGPTSLDEIMDKTNISFGQLTEGLFNLQLKGIVKQLVTGLWELS